MSYEWKITKLLAASSLLTACAAPMGTADGGVDARVAGDARPDVAVDSAVPPMDVAGPDAARPDAAGLDVATDAPSDAPSDASGDAGADSAADVGVDSGPACPIGLRMCGAGCVDTQADTMNCGACGSRCPSGQVCNSGTCGCAADRVSCGGACVDAQSDSMNCGACGTVCPAGRMCVEGACRIDCPSPNTRCSSGGAMLCVNTQTDTANCGTCGAACPTPPNAAAACAAGSCGLGACNAGFGNCDGSAANGCEANFASSSAHCGGCGRACAAGQSCVGGACMLVCGPGQTVCGLACRDLLNDVNHCGGCGNSCGTGANGSVVCFAGACSLGCAMGFGNCDRDLLNGCETSLDTIANCGVCGSVCPTPANGAAGCVARTCGIASCNAGFGNCDGNAANGCETNLGTSATNCGACGRVCSSGQSCVAGTCAATSLTGTVFQLAAMQGTGCSILEHAGVTGDDRGGIAVSSTQVFYSGDTATGRFSAADLSGGASLGLGHDALFSDLATEQVYAFGTVAGPFRGSFGGATVTLDRFFPLNGATGAVGPATMLSAPIPIVDRFAPGQGYFSGFGRVVVVASGRAFDVALPTGTVVDRGPFALGPYQPCESSAIWGVAEFFGGALYVDYVRDSTAIVRQPVVGGGAAGVVATFTNLSDMCSFTVSPARNRWYWHHEGGSQFGGSDESVGFCPLTLRTCREALSAGRTTSGVYTLDPDGAGPLAPQAVYCDQVTDGGGWALVGRIGDPRYLPQLDRNVGTIDAPGGVGNVLHPAWANITGTSIRVGRHVGNGTNVGNLFQINDCSPGDAACWYGRFIPQNDGDTYGAWLTSGGAWGLVPSGCGTDQCPTEAGDRDQAVVQRIAIFGGDCHSLCNVDGDDTRNGLVFRDYGTAAAPSRIGNRGWWGAGTVTSGSAALGVEIPNVDYGQNGAQFRDLWIR